MLSRSLPWTQLSPSAVGLLILIPVGMPVHPGSFLPGFGSSLQAPSPCLCLWFWLSLPVSGTCAHTKKPHLELNHSRGHLWPGLMGEASWSSQRGLPSLRRLVLSSGQCGSHPSLLLPGHLHQWFWVPPFLLSVSSGVPHISSFLTLPS